MEAIKNDTKIMIYKDGEPVWITLSEFLDMMEELKHE